MSISAWMTEAARRALVIADGLTAVAEWEADHGAFSETELAEARQRRSRQGFVRVICDAGVLVAADRTDRAMWAEHRIRLEIGIQPIVTSPVVAQVSRSGRQAQLRRFLRGCQIIPFDAADAHTVGSLLAAAGMSERPPT